MDGSHLDYLGQPAARGVFVLLPVVVYLLFMGVVWGTSIHKDMGLFAWIVSAVLTLACAAPILCRQSVEVDVAQKKAQLCGRCLGIRLIAVPKNLEDVEAVVLSAQHGLDPDAPVAGQQRDGETYRVGLVGRELHFSVHEDASIEAAHARAEQWASYLGHPVTIQETPDFTGGGL